MEAGADLNCCASESLPKKTQPLNNINVLNGHMPADGPLIDQAMKMQ